MRELAERSGVHRNTIINIEAGKPCHRPTMAALERAFQQAQAATPGQISASRQE